MTLDVAATPIRRPESSLVTQGNTHFLSAIYLLLLHPVHQSIPLSSSSHQPHFTTQPDHLSPLTHISSNRPTVIMATESTQASASTPPSTVTKHYEPRGEWTLHRLETATQFSCGQCKKQKKSKLMATKNGNWDDLCCNGCYGTMASKQ
jgi:hypothetical protein